VPETTIPFYALRLSHLVYLKARLVVTCRACRTERVAEVLPLYHRLEPDYSVRDLERRLTCGKCGRRGFGQVRVEWF
jgi:hypothetical protein